MMGPRSKVVGLLIDAWVDLDRVLEGLTFWMPLPTSGFGELRLTRTLARMSSVSEAPGRLTIGARY